MKHPGFTAESTIGMASRTYRGSYRYGDTSRIQAEMSDTVLPNQLDGKECLVDLDEAEPTADIMDEELGAMEELAGESEADVIEDEDIEAKDEALEEREAEVLTGEDDIEPEEDLRLE